VYSLTFVDLVIQSVTVAVHLILVPLISINILNPVAFFVMSFQFQESVDASGQLSLHNFGSVLFHIIVRGNIIIEISSHD